MKSIRIAATLLIAGLAGIALPAAAQVAVTDAWVRGTVTGQKATGAFMQLKSPPTARSSARRRRSRRSSRSTK